MFFGFEILAKRDFFGSVKDVGIFSGREKHWDFLSIVSFISSNQQHKAKPKKYMCFWLHAS